MSAEKAITMHKGGTIIMNDFLMFYAPFIVLIGGLVVAFVVAPMDGAVREADGEGKIIVGADVVVASVFYV